MRPLLPTLPLLNGSASCDRRLALSRWQTPAIVRFNVALPRGIRFCAVEQAVASNHSDGWIHVVDRSSDAERHDYGQFLTRVQPGEAQSLALARHRGLTFATDDRAARLLAARVGIAVTGTLGMLVQLVTDGSLSVEAGN